MEVLHVVCLTAAYIWRLQ